MALVFDMMAEGKRNPEMGKIVDSHNRSMRELLAKLLRYGQAQNEVDANLDLEVAATAIMALTHAAKVATLQNPKSADKTMTMLKQLLIHMVTTPMKMAWPKPRRSKTAARAQA